MRMRTLLGILLRGTAMAVVLTAVSTADLRDARAAAAAPAPQDQADDPVVARVDGVEIRESDLQAADRAMGRNLSMQPEGRRDDVINFMIDTLLFAKAAPARSASEQAEIERRVTIARNRIVMEQMLRAAGDEAVNEAAVRKTYDSLIASMTKEPQLKLHMLDFIVPPSAAKSDQEAVDAAAQKAEAAYARIAKGEAFDVVARELSEDPTTKKNGGYRGFVTRAMMGKDIADVAYALERGKVSRPIRTAAGWHLIMVDGEHELPKPEFQQVRERIEMNLAKQAQTALIERLRANARIERLDAKPTQADAAPKP